MDGQNQHFQIIRIYGITAAVKAPANPPTPQSAPLMARVDSAREQVYWRDALCAMVASSDVSSAQALLHR